METLEWSSVRAKMLSLGEWFRICGCRSRGSGMARSFSLDRRYFIAGFRRGGSRFRERSALEMEFIEVAFSRPVMVSFSYETGTSSYVEWYKMCNDEMSKSIFTWSPNLNTLL